MSHRVYVGTIGEGVFRSLDGGQTFRRAAQGMFVECDVRALVVHPTDPSVLYLGSEQGVFTSQDGADSWSLLSPVGGRQVWALWLQPDRPERILAGTCPSGVWLSEDGGRTWTESVQAMMQDCPGIRHTRVTSFTADPTNPQRVWAGVEIDGIHVSQDGGKNWHPLAPAKDGMLTSRDIHGLAALPGASGLRLLATTNRDLNVSDNGGQTWRAAGMDQVTPWFYTRGLAQKEGEPRTLLMGVGDGPPGSEGGVARSADGGQSWKLSRMPGRSNSTMWCFATHPSNPERIYAASVSGQLYRSEDGGVSWEKLAREFGEIRALAWTP